MRRERKHRRQKTLKTPFLRRTGESCGKYFFGGATWAGGKNSPTTAESRSMRSRTSPESCCRISSPTTKARNEWYARDISKKRRIQIFGDDLTSRRIVITSGEWCLDTSFYHTGSHCGFLFVRCPTSFYNRPKKKNRVTTIA